MKKEIKSGINPESVKEFVMKHGKSYDPFHRVSDFDYVKSIKGKPLKKLTEYLKKRMKKRKMYMVLMQLKNGKYHIMNVCTSSSYFIFDNGAYYVDSNMVREETSSKLNLLFYHQGVSVPIKLDFDTDELYTNLQSSCSDVEKAVNPGSLRAFINSQVIEKVLQGAEMLKDLVQMKLMIIINILMTGGLLVAIGKLSGWF